MDALGRRIVETLRQGKEYEYGFLGIRLDPQRAPTGWRRPSRAPPPARASVQVDDAIVAVGDIPVDDADSLVLAINTIPAGDAGQAQAHPPGRVDRADRRAGQVPGRGRGDRHQPPRRPGAGSGSTTRARCPTSTFGQDLLDAMARGGVVVAEVEPGSPAEQAGLKTGQVITHVGGRKVRNPPRIRPGRRRRLNGPVRLDTDLGPVVVK